jgi:uncharacterized OB-fold protein
MPNEQEYPTMRFMKCKKCGTVYVASIGGKAECPECSSRVADTFAPDEEPETPPGADPA